MGVQPQPLEIIKLALAFMVSFQSSTSDKRACSRFALDCGGESPTELRLWERVIQTSLGVEFGLIKVSNNLLNGVDRTIPKYR
jgi:hypothetical protein